jgi:hypothetical protein
MKEDKRKTNGGHSTKSISKFDKRIRGNFEDKEVVDNFLEDIKDQMLDFYKKAFVNKVKEVTSDSFYVYAHLIKNEVVYVGKGSGNRVYQRNRSVKEHNVLLLNGDISFKILSSGMCNEIALMVEFNLIDFYKPIYNIKL